MTNYFAPIIFILIIFVIRFVLYFSKFLYLKKVLVKQDVYVTNAFKKDPNEAEVKIANKAGNWVNENHIEIKKVVLKTGVSDFIHTTMEPVGYGHIQEKKLSALDNLLYKNIKILQESREMLERAKGYYKVESIKSLNPIFWIEFLVFLPREIINYLTVSDKKEENKLWVNIIQVMYWIISIIFMYLNYLKH
jgi:hypothetical protein